MKNWLKYFFGAFFSQKLAREGQWRGLSNNILAFLFALVFTVLGIFTGQSVAFPSYYEKTEGFKDFLYTSLLGESALKIQDGKAGFNQTFNGYAFLEKEEGSQNFEGFSKAFELLDGYNLVIDTRDLTHVYDEFIPFCLSKDGDKISYEEYLLLSPSDRLDYGFKVEYSGIDADFSKAEKVEKHRDFLKEVSTPNSPSYKSEIAKLFEELEKGKDGEMYEEELYLLYLKAYYPDLSGFDNYSYAPTRLGYYEKLRRLDGEGKFLFILAEKSYVSMGFGEGKISFIGYHGGLKDCVVDSKEGVDRFLKDLHASSGALNLVATFANLWRAFIFLFFVWIILSLIVYLVGKKNISCLERYSSAFLIVGSFLTVSGLIGGLFAFVLSFFALQGTVFNLTLYVLCAVWVIRILTFLIIEFFRNKNENADGEEREVAE